MILSSTMWITMTRRNHISLLNATANVNKVCLSCCGSTTSGKRQVHCAWLLNCLSGAHLGRAVFASACKFEHQRGGAEYWWCSLRGEWSSCCSRLVLEDVMSFRLDIFWTLWLLEINEWDSKIHLRIKFYVNHWLYLLILWYIDFPITIKESEV